MFNTCREYRNENNKFLKKNDIANEFNLDMEKRERRSNQLGTVMLVLLVVGGACLFSGNEGLAFIPIMICLAMLFIQPG